MLSRIVPRDSTRFGPVGVEWWDMAHTSAQEHLGDGGALGAGVAPPEPASKRVGEGRQPAADEVARADARPNLRRDRFQPPFPNFLLLSPLAAIEESRGINK